MWFLLSFLFAVLFSSNIGIVQPLPVRSLWGEAVGMWECVHWGVCTSEPCCMAWSWSGLVLPLVQEDYQALEWFLGRSGHFPLILVCSSRIALPSVVVLALWDQRYSFWLTKLTLTFTVHCVLAVLLSVQQERSLKVIWPCPSKSTAADLICSKHTPWNHPIWRTLSPVLICHHLHHLQEEVSLFLQLTADQSSFAIIICCH